MLSPSEDRPRDQETVLGKTESAPIDRGELDRNHFWDEAKFCQVLYGRYNLRILALTIVCLVAWLLFYPLDIMNKKMFSELNFEYRLILRHVFVPVPILFFVFLSVVTIMLLTCYREDRATSRTRTHIYTIVDCVIVFLFFVPLQMNLSVIQNLRILTELALPSGALATFSGFMTVSFRLTPLTFFYIFTFPILAFIVSYLVAYHSEVEPWSLALRLVSVLGVIISVHLSVMLQATATEKLARRLFRQKLSLEVVCHQARIENERGVGILLNILPRKFAIRLQQFRNRRFVDVFSELALVQTDLVEFTSFASECTSSRLISIVNLLFTKFDEKIDMYGLEKVKTIGDAVRVYDPESRHLHCLEFSISLLHSLQRVNKKADEEFEMRVGIGCGAGCVGVIGEEWLSFDCYGEVVQEVTELESKGEPGMVHVSPKLADSVRRGLVELPNQSLIASWRESEAYEGALLLQPTSTEEGNVSVSSPVDGIDRSKSKASLEVLQKVPSLIKTFDLIVAESSRKQDAVGALETLFDDLDLQNPVEKCESELMKEEEEEEERQKREDSLLLEGGDFEEEGKKKSRLIPWLCLYRDLWSNFDYAVDCYVEHLNHCFRTSMLTSLVFVSSTISFLLSSPSIIYKLPQFQMQMWVSAASVGCSIGITLLWVFGRYHSSCGSGGGRFQVITFWFLSTLQGPVLAFLYAISLFIGPPPENNLFRDMGTCTLITMVQTITAFVSIPWIMKMLFACVFCLFFIPSFYTISGTFLSEITYCLVMISVRGIGTQAVDLLMLRNHETRRQIEADLESLKGRAKLNDRILQSFLPEFVIEDLKKRDDLNVGLIHSAYQETLDVGGEEFDDEEDGDLGGGTTTIGQMIPMMSSQVEDGSVAFVHVEHLQIGGTEDGGREALSFLSDLFSGMDRIVRNNSSFRVKTIGLTYIFCCQTPSHRVNVAKCALLIRSHFQDCVAAWPSDGKGSTLPVSTISLRIGLHSGGYHQGIVGSKKYLFDCFGDTINVGSRMSTLGVDSEIQCSSSFVSGFEGAEEGLDAVRFRLRGDVFVKGQGMMQTYFLETGFDDEREM